MKSLAKNRPTIQHGSTRQVASLDRVRMLAALDTNPFG